MVASDGVAKAENQAGRVDNAEDEVYPSDETCDADLEWRAAGNDGFVVNDDLEAGFYGLVIALAMAFGDIIFVIGGGYNWGMVGDAHWIFLLLSFLQKPFGIDLGFAALL